MIKSLCAGGNISLQFFAVSTHGEQSPLGMLIEPTKWNQSKDSHSICKHQRIQTKRVQENVSQGLCLYRSGLSKIQPCSVHQLERLCLRHCLMARLFIPDTLHYGAYVRLPVYRLRDRIEATIAFPTQTNLKINAAKGRTVFWISMNYYLCQIKEISKGQ